MDLALPMLLNELAASPVQHVLVLDDYHLLTDRRIHEAVEFLVTYLPAVAAARRRGPRGPAAAARPAAGPRRADRAAGRGPAVLPRRGGRTALDGVGRGPRRRGDGGGVGADGGLGGGPAAGALAAREREPNPSPTGCAATTGTCSTTSPPRCCPGLAPRQRDLLVRAAPLERLSGLAVRRRTAGRGLGRGAGRAGARRPLRRRPRRRAGVVPLPPPAARRAAARRRATDSAAAVLGRAAAWFAGQDRIDDAVRHLLRAGRRRRRRGHCCSATPSRGSSNAGRRRPTCSSASSCPLAAVGPTLALISLAFAAALCGRPDRVVRWLGRLRGRARTRHRHPRLAQRPRRRAVPARELRHRRRRDRRGRRPGAARPSSWRPQAAGRAPDGRPAPGARAGPRRPVRRGRRAAARRCGARAATDSGRRGCCCRSPASGLCLVERAAATSATGCCARSGRWPTQSSATGGGVTPWAGRPAHRRGPASLPEAGMSTPAAASAAARRRRSPSCIRGRCMLVLALRVPRRRRTRRAATVRPPAGRAGRGPARSSTTSRSRRSRCSGSRRPRPGSAAGRPGSGPVGRPRRGADRPRAVDPADAAGLGDRSARSAPRCSCRSTRSRPTTRASTASSASRRGRTPSPPRGLGLDPQLSSAGALDAPADGERAQPRSAAPVARGSAVPQSRIPMASTGRVRMVPRVGTIVASQAKQRRAERARLPRWPLGGWAGTTRYTA